MENNNEVKERITLSLDPADIFVIDALAAIKYKTRSATVRRLAKSYGYLELAQLQETLGVTHDER